MRKAYYGTFAIAIGLAISGCGQANTAAEAGQQFPAGVVDVLPNHVAAHPINLNIPSMDRPPVVQAVYDGKSAVNVTVRSKWRGSTVTLYHLPRYNLSHEGTHYRLLGARGVQRIGKYPIDEHGHWRANWTVGNYPIPPHRPMYLLAVTDAGQVGLVQMDSL
ncbi:hypothetical protein [Alicyclobacillus mengziensis]|uniref:L,D-transpeptidase n=1 Tax=Alicyclobacillus mengziensis TaxID=2931921 RepID=A0A9X7W2Z8_9BACL|nr:hypothetical protein [Alicyclobacillus mengziensis]QSO48323.1 hypothetical protein JZ786_04865 [Alicyclobacillus mengziensis]